MKVAFVGVFCASFQPFERRGEMALFGRRRGNSDVSKGRSNTRDITFELPPYTYSQNIRDFENLRDPNRIASTMWKDYVENSGQLDPKLNRPMRHYPAHHYRREYKQKIGLIRKEAKVQKMIRTATTPLPSDNCLNVPQKMRPQILDAFDKFEQWLKLSQARLSQNAKEESDNESTVSTSAPSETTGPDGLPTSVVDQYCTQDSQSDEDGDDYELEDNNFNMEDTDLTVHDYIDNLTGYSDEGTYFSRFDDNG
ncbi:IS4 family protein, putative [Babesia ovis]|uniref:IS4 family protein, putative n=1 Tax=Babesia ovis TaxID=5869 RepID=A0A9W5TDK0_BABOV|nr:IS4 family protein, putative [Babesia ovis]